MGEAALMPLPITVEWAPTSDPLDPTPTWETLGRVWEGSTVRGGRGSLDEYDQGTAAVARRNGNTAGESAAILWDASGFHKWRPFRVMANLGTDEPLFSGYIKDIVHGGRLPAAATVAIAAADAFGVWARQSLVYELDVAWAEPGGMDTDVQDLSYDIDDQSTSIGTFDNVGLIYAPVFVPFAVYDLPAVDGVVEQVGDFRGNAVETLQKALDVELGTFHCAADGTPCVNGRYTVPLEITDASPAFVLSDTPAGGEYPFRDPKFSSPYTEWRNQATSTGLKYKRAGVEIERPSFVAGVPATGVPVDAIERGDVWTKSDAWVKANAGLLAALYTSVAEVHPSEVTVTLWDTTTTDLTLAEAVVAATAILGRKTITVRATLPGQAQSEWLCTLEGVTHSFSAELWRATLKLGQSAQRWSTAYDLSVGLFSLDDTDRGLDTDAIIGP